MDVIAVVPLGARSRATKVDLGRQRNIAIKIKLTAGQMGSLTRITGSPGFFPPRTQGILGVVLLLLVTVGLDTFGSSGSFGHLFVVVLGSSLGFVVLVVALRHSTRDLCLGGSNVVRHRALALYIQTGSWSQDREWWQGNAECDRRPPSQPTRLRDETGQADRQAIWQARTGKL